MYYIKVRWIHQNADDPVFLLSELDAERYETRKIEIYADGSKEYASATEKVGETELGTVPVPLLADIAADAEFLPEDITQSVFELAWANRRLPEKAN